MKKFLIIATFLPPIVFLLVIFQLFQPSTVSSAQMPAELKIKHNASIFIKPSHEEIQAGNYRAISPSHLSANGIDDPTVDPKPGDVLYIPSLRTVKEKILNKL